MASNSDEIVKDFPPFFKVLKDGEIQRYPDLVSDLIPPPHDPLTGLQSKDVVVSASDNAAITARLFFHNSIAGGESRPLPVLLHIHGGGFCIGSALDSITANFIAALLFSGGVIAVSVEYRLAPESPLPIAYEDSLAALRWVASHAAGGGPEAILNDRADLRRVFLMGESAGANIAQYVAVRAGLEGLRLAGLMVVHPFFVGEECDEMYRFLCPGSSGCGDDPRLNPASDPNVESMACERVLVCVAGKDRLRSRGLAYYETLRRRRGSGVVLFESENEDHCFHMFDPKKPSALALIDRLLSFINHE